VKNSEIEITESRYVITKEKDNQNQQKENLQDCFLHLQLDLATKTKNSLISTCPMRIL